jgi:hypothetical protein
VIKGVDLDQVTQVYFGTVVAGSFQIDSATEITAIAPSSSRPGMVTISLFDKDNNGGFNPVCLVDPGCGSNYTYTSEFGLPTPTTVPAPSQGGTSGLPSFVPGDKESIQTGR